MTCKLCNDEKYLLANIDGVLKASFCGCFECRLCEGSGAVYVEDERGYSTTKPCDCVPFRRRLQLLNETGIPGRFHDVKLNSYKPVTQSQKDAKTLAVDYVREFEGTPQGLLFMGFPGVGKTHLAVSIIKGLVLGKDVDCRFVDFSNLLSDLRHGYSQNVSDRDLLEPYLDSRIMVIDELGKGRNTEWELAILDQVISARYNAGDKVTICTTNYLISDKKFSLNNRVGGRVYSRLVEMCRLVRIDGFDHRQRDLSPADQYLPVER